MWLHNLGLLLIVSKQVNCNFLALSSDNSASSPLPSITSTVKIEILRHLVGHLHETWDDWLSQVAASIKSSVNSPTGKTPHYIIFGYDKRLPYELLLQSPSPLYKPEDYSKLQLHSFQTIHASVREKLKALREEVIQRHLHATPITLDVGDSAMKRSPELSCKLAPKFMGPYLALAKLHGNTFKVLGPSTSISEVVHTDRLKKASPALSPVADTSPFPPDI